MRRLPSGTAPTPLTRALRRPLQPLLLALLAALAFVAVLAWGAMQLQVTADGLLAGESLWSKAQKQAVLELYAYAQTGADAHLQAYIRQQAVLHADSSARRLIQADPPDRAAAALALRRGGVDPAAIPGVLFTLRRLRRAPYVQPALLAWRHADRILSPLPAIAATLRHEYATPAPSAPRLRALGERILRIDADTAPQARRFSRSISEGARLLSRLLFALVTGGATIALLAWWQSARRLLRQLRDAERRCRLLFEQMDEAVLVTQTRDGRVIGANPAATALLGRDADSLRDMRLDQLVDLADAGGSHDDDGRRRNMVVRSSPLPGANGRLRVARIRASDNGAGNSGIDALTGLANRHGFERACNRTIAAVDADGSQLAVLFIDLDGFKAINDSFGRAAGDRFLQQVAMRIVDCIGDAAAVARLGGDEFTVHLVDRDDAARAATRAAARAGELLQRLAEPFHLGDRDVQLSASIGIAVYPDHGRDASALVTHADMAMNAAKHGERNAYRLYHPTLQPQGADLYRLAGDLRRALTRGELRLLFQPCHALADHRILAVETLLRWRHPQRGEMDPSHFIPVAEQTGAIHDIGRWVLREACIQGLPWLTRDPQLHLAVNVSARTFGHPDFVADVRRTLDATGFPARNLVLEITESAILRLGDRTHHALHALHALGVSLAVDDFGAGYSSLAYLKLPGVRYLKIDRSFVAGIPTRADDRAIAEAVLALARALDLTAIAEGVETTAQHDFLLQAGCAMAQGFLLSRPMPAAELATRLAG